MERGVGGGIFLCFGGLRSVVRKGGGRCCGCCGCESGFLDWGQVEVRL